MKEHQSVVWQIMAAYIKQGFDIYLCRARSTKGRKSNIAWRKCNPSGKTDPMDSPSSSINQCSKFINWTDRRLNKTQDKNWISKDYHLFKPRSMILEKERIKNYVEPAIQKLFKFVMLKKSNIWLTYKLQVINICQITILKCENTFKSCIKYQKCVIEEKGMGRKQEDVGGSRNDKVTT